MNFAEKPENMPNPEERRIQRNLLRHEKIAAREALAPSLHQTLSAQLEQHLIALLNTCAPRIIGLYWPFRAEFDCRPLMAKLVANGIRACLPVVTRPQAPLEFRHWQTDSEMAVDRYGLHYPASGAALCPDLLLIPVNAFDAAGYRIGYGSGYFDRTLAHLQPKPLSIGIGFTLARVASIAPEAHDIPLDAVVTESGVEIFSSRLAAKI